jgi:hypothetical protein
MFRFDYDPTEYGRPSMAEPKSPEPVALRGADKTIRWWVAHRWSEWRPEVPWMSLYFSVGVWLSLCFVFV